MVAGGLLALDSDDLSTCILLAPALTKSKHDEDCCIPKIYCKRYVPGRRNVSKLEVMKSFLKLKDLRSVLVARRGCCRAAGVLVLVLVWCPVLSTFLVRDTIEDCKLKVGLHKREREKQTQSMTRRGYSRTGMKRKPRRCGELEVMVPLARRNERSRWSRKTSRELEYRSSFTMLLMTMVMVVRVRVA